MTKSFPPSELPTTRQLRKPFEERDRGHQAAGHAERPFAAVADRLPQILWSARSDGAMESCNRWWFDFTGLTPEETKGQGWKRALHPEDAPRCGAVWMRSVQTGEPWEVTCRLRRGSDGAYRWYLGRALAQRGPTGGTRLWYGSFTDIEDERARRVEAERARDKEQEAARRKDELLALVSHELRTPLNAILGWGRMLQAESLNDEQRRRAIDTILRSARAQSRLIDDLLDASRVAAGTLRLEARPIHLHLLVELALESAGPLAETKGVRLEPTLDAELGLVSGDAGRLEQVLGNLLTNALKFTPRGGLVRIGLWREDASAVIVVTDTGDGIAPDFLPYVFDQYRQQERSARRAGGLGLGLALVKSLVELHGGSVEAHSDGHQRGATFLVRLPLLPRARRARQASPYPPPLETPTPCPSPASATRLDRRLLHPREGGGGGTSPRSRRGCAPVALSSWRDVLR